jgi:hypothetical protein
MKVLDGRKVGFHKNMTEFALVDLPLSCKNGQLECNIYQLEDVALLAEFHNDLLYTLHNNEDNLSHGNTKV